MARSLSPPGHVPLPGNWPALARSATLDAVSLAHLALVHSRSWAANSPIERVRLRADNDQLRTEVALLREEIRIKDERMGLVPAGDRPRYPPHERLAILAVRAARGWSAARTARAFQVTAPTIASWTKRLDDDGPGALVQLPVPVNKLPEFVTAIVQRLRALCPLLGKVRIAQMLARAGLHVSASTVGRALRKPPSGDLSPTSTEKRRQQPPASAEPAPKRESAEPGPKRVVTARHPHHVWHIDLTVMPALLGFWLPWMPYSVAQRWPFGVWIAVVLDHYSRSVVARGVFEKQPSASDVCELLDRGVRDARAFPKHIVSDQGAQFQKEYRAWCHAHGVKPRFGAVGHHGSIAILERFIRSMKDECFRTIVVPPALDRVERELDLWLGWYHEHRPHQGLAGRTPAEMLVGEHDRKRRHRSRAPPNRRKLRPLRLVVSHVEGRAHLPIVELRRAA